LYSSAYRPDFRTLPNTEGQTFDTASFGTNLGIYDLKKIYKKLPSLMMKVADHVYVLGDTYTCHTLTSFFAFQLILIPKMSKLVVAVATYVPICTVYRILPSFAFHPIVVQKMWRFAVAFANYVSICIVYSIHHFLLYNGIDACIGHTCNTARLTRYCNNMRLNG
jgi:hypothetical protein